MRKVRLTNCNIDILVDDEDYIRVSLYEWRLKDYSRVETKINLKNIYIARFLLNEYNPTVNIDHKDRNIFNNQKDNLRRSTKAQNGMNRSAPINNSSDYKGVWWSTQKQKWQACIVYNKQKKHLGFFNNKEDAAKAYNEGALKYHKEFACLNIIKENK